MATVLYDTFTDADSTAVTAHAPNSGGSWSVITSSGTLPVIYANAVTGQGEANAYYLHSANATGNGETVIGNWFLEPAAGGPYGLMVRGNPASGGSWYMCYWNGGPMSLWRRNAGTFTQIATLTSFTPTGNHEMKLTVTGTGATVTLEVFMDSTSLGTYSDTSASRLTTLGSSGFLLCNSTVADGYRLDTITFTDSASSGGVTITTPADGRIHQRSGSSGTITVAGTYTGTPTSLEARLVNDGTGTAVSGFDWSTKVASPSGGTYSFSFTSVPEGGWYNVQVRFSNDTGINATGNKVGIGALYAVLGQSPSYYWFHARSTTTDPDTKIRVYGNVTSGAWSAPDKTNMAAAVHFGNSVIAAASIPVGMLDYGASGGAMSDHWIPTSNTTNAAFEAAVAALDGKLEGVIWAQGESDAVNARTQAQYYGDLSTLFLHWRTTFTQSALPIILVTLGRTTEDDVYATDAEWQAIFDAQVQKCADTAIYRVDRKDLALSDTVHQDSAGFVELGKRCALAANYINGYVSQYRGPSVSSVIRVNSTTFDVLLEHHAGSDFTPTTGITGFIVLDAGTPVTISAAVRQTASRIRLTLASTTSALPTVRYFYGKNPTITNDVLDNSTLTLPVEGLTTITSVAAPTATITLVNSSNTPQASLSNLKWAWFDEVTPDLFVAPTDQGSTESTDGSGVLTVDIANTLKTSGQVGFLIVSDSDGTTTQSPAHKAFAGPVAID